MHRHDVLILGSGLAALTTALKLADQRRIAIVTKRQMTDGATGRRAGLRRLLITGTRSRPMSMTPWSRAGGCVTRLLPGWWPARHEK
jgi:glycine/D-amino acid oxidase-like deaminating enzyme